MNEPSWALVYDLALDAKQIEAVQVASLNKPGFGFPISPFLFGSAAWWEAIETGAIETVTTEGTIEHVFWGSMGDWPEFKMHSLDGSESVWTREGDVTRYVEGLKAKVTYVVLRRKPDAMVAAGQSAKVVLRIWIESSDERTPFYKGFRGSRTPDPEALRHTHSFPIDRAGGDG